MPGVLSRYIRYENAGDQFVGKSVSGRSRNKKTFAASQPYWDFSAEGREAKEANEEHLHRWLRDRLPDQAKTNHKIFLVHKMCVASIAYHREYLNKHLHPDSVLRSSSLWNDDIPFDDKVVVKYPWNATEDTPEITGLPPDITLLAALESMQQQMTELKAELKASFESTLIEQLNQRDVGGSGFARGNEIAEKLNAILNKVADLSRTAQVSTGVSKLPAMDEMSELEESGGLECEEGGRRRRRRILYSSWTSQRACLRTGALGLYTSGLSSSSPIEQ